MTPIDSLESLLSEGGALSRLLPGFEVRPGQVRMLQAVVEAFLQQQVLVVEAGTGVGKSLAYGLPAAAFALAAGQRVVISTATINLQEQLVHKDLPLVARALAAPSGQAPSAALGETKPLEVVLVKGRGNYLCRRRLMDRSRQRLLLLRDGVIGEEGLEEDLQAWAGRSTDGSRSDLPFPVREEVWEEVCSDADACLGGRCPCRSECFFAAARRRAEHAHLLVVNHHLLFADLALRKEHGTREGRGILPPFGRVILDEAHEVEDAASGFFGLRIGRQGVLRQLARLHAPSRRGGSSLLLQVAAEVAAAGRIFAAGKSERIQDEAAGPVADLAGDTRRAFEAAFEGLSDFGLRLGGRAGVGDARLRLTPAVAEDPGWTAVREGFLLAAARCQELGGKVERLVSHLAELREEDGKSAEARCTARRLLELAEATRRLVSIAEDDLVRWLEVSRKGRGRVQLASAPLGAGALIGEALLRPMETVVFTSATLAVESSFSFFCARTGVSRLETGPSRVRTVQAVSPFDFPNQARLGVPSDLPAPTNPFFEQALPEAVFQAVSLSGGRALVLFTSWALMGRVAEITRERLEMLGIEVLCQGEAPRDQLLNRFREEETSVLFGTDSFWQGVDVIGPALRNVVITRLPFDVPDEPLTEARQEAIERAGGSAFNELSLPRAVLRLKQGFGRLIRSASDWGLVVVLDRRLLSINYGARFLQSLPPATLVTGSFSEVCRSLAAFYAERSGETPSRLVPE